MAECDSLPTSILVKRRNRKIDLTAPCSPLHEQPIISSLITGTKTVGRIENQVLTTIRIGLHHRHFDSAQQYIILDEFSILNSNYNFNN